MTYKPPNYFELWKKSFEKDTGGLIPEEKMNEYIHYFNSRVNEHILTTLETIGKELKEINKTLKSR